MRKKNGGSLRHTVRDSTASQILYGFFEQAHEPTKMVNNALRGILFHQHYTNVICLKHGKVSLYFTGNSTIT